MSPEEELPPVTLVLDRSALLAYVAGSIHAVEPVGEVVTDRLRFGATAVTVAEALKLVTDPKDRQDLHALLAMDACAVLPTWGEDWLELSYWLGVTSRVDLATTVLASLEHGAQILTGEGHRYGEGLAINYMPNQ
ncbi:hypothetical protein GA0070558_16017 [Micromonospora haikouensis]|uniref:PIN domain-containing protein n=1 Tax=Micromonospora haikouensis TaxID=686309 RepID=A0A1C4YP96_9ACTN|nr:hypothetical protein [Micromonospora haikouensis]SCF22555.1 hypothetical protein GA0070558_16017 [Micromonospora haikouensis]